MKNTDPHSSKERPFPTALRAKKVQPGRGRNSRAPSRRIAAIFLPPSLTPRAFVPLAPPPGMPLIKAAILYLVICPEISLKLIAAL